jgi:hypothetical protein
LLRPSRVYAAACRKFKVECSKFKVQSSRFKVQSSKLKGRASSLRGEHAVPFVWRRCCRPVAGASQRPYPDVHVVTGVLYPSSSAGSVDGLAAAAAFDGDGRQALGRFDPFGAG